MKHHHPKEVEKQVPIVNDKNLKELQKHFQQLS